MLSASQPRTSEKNTEPPSHAHDYYLSQVQTTDLGHPKPVTPATRYRGGSHNDDPARYCNYTGSKLYDRPLYLNYMYNSKTLLDLLLLFLHK